ncbi:MAG: hypothetical protein WDN24_08450 [Sphingomonas sp.]
MSKRDYPGSDYSAISTRAEFLKLYEERRKPRAAPEYTPGGSITPVVNAIEAQRHEARIAHLRERLLGAGSSLRAGFDPAASGDAGRKPRLQREQERGAFRGRNAGALSKDFDRER